MKRFFSYVMLLAIFIAVIPMRTSAEAVDVIYYEDGTYFTVEIEESETRASGTKSGTKSYTYNDSNGSALWKATLTGTFSYTGSSASCTAASCSVTIYNSDWYTKSKSSSKSGNTAYGNVTMGRTSSGVTVGTKSASISLSCDANGNLS